MIVAPRAVHGGTVVPHDQIVRLPDMGVDQLALRRMLDQISQELRSQYNIGYTPTNTNRDGSFRRVDIKSKQGDHKIQARSGYYAVPRRED